MKYPLSVKPLHYQFPTVGGAGELFRLLYVRSTAHPGQYTSLKIRLENPLKFLQVDEDETFNGFGVIDDTFRRETKLRMSVLPGFLATALFSYKIQN